MAPRRTCECMTCPKCRTRERDLVRTRLMAYGRWEPWADPEPARQHVRDLMAAGMSLARISAAADVWQTRVSKLLYGREGRAVTKIRTEFSRALLAVEASPLLVPSCGAQRRLAALVAIGYSQNVLAREMGVSQNRVWELLHRDSPVTRDTLAKVTAVYERLCMTPPPRETARQKQSVSRALSAAQKNGWAPPLAYDNIDDPDEKPHGLRMVWHKGPGRDDYDEAVVLRILGGDFKLSATEAERREVVRRWDRHDPLTKQRGKRRDDAEKPSLAYLERLTGWRVSRYVTREDGAA